MSITSVPVIDSDKEVVKVPYIHYLVQFQESQGQENQKQIKGLLDNSCKINAINPAFPQNLGFYIQKTNVGAQKIDGSILETFGIVIANF